MPVVQSVETHRNVVALTFDDGPKLPETERLLDVLSDTDARATFFVRGGAIDRETKELVTRAAREGHEIGNHTHSHHPLDAVDRATVHEEIARTHFAVAELTGAPPDLVRPPYGRGLELVNEVAASLGYRATVSWSVDASDWECPPAATIVDRILADLAPGAIVLLHDGCSPDRVGQKRIATIEATRTLIPLIRQRGLELVTVSELLDSV